MEYNNTTANSRKNKHLNDFERGQIQLLHNKGYSAYRIAKTASMNNIPTRRIEMYMSMPSLLCITTSEVIKTVRDYKVLIVVYMIIIRSQPME